MTRFQMLSDVQWSLIEEMAPRPTGRKGRPFADARLMVEGLVYRYRCGIAWRDLPEVSSQKLHDQPRCERVFGRGHRGEHRQQVISKRGVQSAAPQSTPPEILAQVGSASLSVA